MIIFSLQILLDRFYSRENLFRERLMWTLVLPYIIFVVYFIELAYSSLTLATYLVVSAIGFSIVWGDRLFFLGILLFSLRVSFI